MCPCHAARVLGALALLAASACGRSATTAGEVPGVSSPDVRTAVDFDFDSLDDRAVSSAATRGQPTVIAFVDTGSLPAQAQVDYLVAMAKHDGDKVHYVAVALERGEQRELVELYRKALGVPFPMALADKSTLVGGGPFGDVTAVPVTVILDRVGRVTFRVAGRVSKPDELRAALRRL